MRERDHLQLINTPLIADIRGMDRAAHWQLILDNLEFLVAKERRETGCIYGYPYGMEHFEKIFNRFYDEDPDATISGLINDLCFTGPEIPATFWSRQGYLDNISSADVPTAHDILPKWDNDSEAWVYFREFDVLNADHIGLMAASLTANSHNLATDEYTTQLLSLKTLTATLRSTPTLNAAYIYETNYY